VSLEAVESVLSRQIDDLKPTLTRNGYSIKDLVNQFDSKAGEIKALFNNAVVLTRTAALREKMRPRINRVVGVRVAKRFAVVPLAVPVAWVLLTRDPTAIGRASFCEVCEFCRRRLSCLDRGRCTPPHLRPG